MNTKIQRNAFSLLEITAALVISATVAVAGIQYLRPAGDTGKQRSCDLTREMAQNDAQRYFEYTGSMPGTDLNELVSPEYSGAVLPTCPVTGQAYRFDKDNNVVCPTHEATRLN